MINGVRFFSVKGRSKTVLELSRDTTDRNLGRREHTCRVCGERGAFLSYLVREMLNGTKDEFEYFVCDNCGCLQISDVPDNLGEYYGNTYYSFGFEAGQSSDFDQPADSFDKILDVGCGSGKWLYNAAKAGCTNLYGCDPFLENEIRYGDRVQIKNCSIHEMDGDESFDMIMMQDSFEHVTDPKETLDSAFRLLKNDGTLFLSLPVFPNLAFDMFETHWYQLDAPRHIILHSLKSLNILAEQCNFTVTGHKYDSINSMLVYSFFYQNGIPKSKFTDELVRTYFSDDAILKINSTVDSANKNNKGDHIKMTMRKRI